MPSIVQSLYERFREALQNGGALTLSPDEIRLLADIGAYGLLQDADNMELGIKCLKNNPRTSLATSGLKSGKTVHHLTSGKSGLTTTRLDRGTISALIAGTSKTPNGH